MLSDRRLDVLRAIVAEYVRTREPVGSKAIASGHEIGVSSATIRNDMAALEESGLIYQPHTSAGRVPTDKGYRLFVDHLSAIKPMSAPEARAVESFLDECVELDDIVQRTVKLLAHATRQVAVMQYPHTSLVTLRRVELVDITPHRLLVVVIADNGSVNERMLELPMALDAHSVARLNAVLNAELAGLGAQGINDKLHDLPAWQASIAVGMQNAAGVEDSLVNSIVKTIADVFNTPTETRIAVAGLSNLARLGVEFRDIVPVLDALEEQVVLLRLFAEHSQLPSDVHITIGKENPDDVLAEATVITSHYDTYGLQSAAANVGIVGPMRMDYARTISTVRSVAAYLSRYFNRET